MRPTGIVFLNGRYVPAARATVNVFDRGLLYGDGLFETMRSYGGAVFAVPAHLERLNASARILGFSVPGLDWKTIFAVLLRRNRLRRTDAWIRLTVTRGVGAPGLLPRDMSKPTVIATARRVPAEYAHAAQHGIAVAVLPFARCDFLAEHKSLNYLPSILGRLLAAEQDSGEGVFCDESGYLREGTTSSLFVVRDGALSTVPASGILPGVTRHVVLELAARAGIPTLEQPLTRKDLAACEEIFLTSSVAEIVPVVKMAHETVGNGHPGPVTRALQRLYRRAVAESGR